MKISDSNIQMAAQWSSTKRTSMTESLRAWDDRVNSSLLTNESVQLDISDKGKALLKNIEMDELQNTDDETVQLTDKDKEKIKLIEDFIFVLTGKRIHIKIPNGIKKAQMDKLKQLAEQEAAKAVRPRQVGWGINYQYHSSVEEHEKLAFASSGSVTTADGRTIDFDLAFQVSRNFVSTENVSIKAGDALLDPLVINFKNASADLGARNYSFDIDTDGDNENIAFTAQGSGFLALDKNGNGSIDDGSELFGPQSGNGFNELAQYDLDGNNWIDENDAIFNKLRIWTLDESGDKQLIALGQAGVGAIYLGNVTSPFSIKDSSNDMSGQISRTGVFLNEDGAAGTIQHVDLSV